MPCFEAVELKPFFDILEEFWAEAPGDISLGDESDLVEEVHDNDVGEVAKSDADLAESDADPAPAGNETMSPEPKSEELTPTEPEATPSPPARAEADVPAKPDVSRDRQSESMPPPSQVPLKRHHHLALPPPELPKDMSAQTQDQIKMRIEALKSLSVICALDQTSM